MALACTKDLLPWHVVYQQMRRWLDAGYFELLVEHVRSLLREWAEGQGQPAVTNSRTLESTPESRARAGWNGAKPRQGLSAHIAVDLLGLLLALEVIAAIEADRAQMAELAEQVQEVTGSSPSWLMWIRVRPVRPWPLKSTASGCKW